jgi:hypothetical protein
VGVVRVTGGGVLVVVLWLLAGGVGTWIFGSLDLERWRDK